MKLFYSPAACSLSPHITLRASGLPFEIERVSLRDKTTESGRDYNTVNPKGYVPALELDDGQVLTEGPAILQYIADQVPEAKLAPPNGTLARYRLQEWLNYLSTELHKQYSPLFNKATPDEQKDAQRALIRRRLAFIEAGLGDGFLMGEDYSVADGYLFTVLYWNRWVGLDLEGLPKLAAWQTRMAALPFVTAALRAEHLIKD